MDVEQTAAMKKWNRQYEPLKSLVQNFDKVACKQLCHDFLYIQSSKFEGRNCCDETLRVLESSSPILVTGKNELFVKFDVK